MTKFRHDAFLGDGLASGQNGLILVEHLGAVVQRARHIANIIIISASGRDGGWGRRGGGKDPIRNVGLSLTLGNFSQLFKAFQIIRSHLEHLEFVHILAP